MQKNKLIESTKKINRIGFEVEKELNLECKHICMICKEKVSSFCKSHSIPHNIFDHMSLENDEIIPDYNAAMANILTKIYKGKNNSGIFKLICKSCDQKYFSKLDNFDVIGGKWNNELLRLQAQRINLYQVYRLKQFSYTLYKMFDKQFTNSKIKESKSYINSQIQYYKETFYKYDNSGKEEFEILFDDVLAYETDFTTVTVLPMIFNPYLDFMIKKSKTAILTFESQCLNNKNSFTTVNLSEKQNNIMYLVVFPYEGKTRVTLFCNKKSICSVLVKTDFENLSTDDKLLYISSSLIILGRNTYGNHSFKQKYRSACKIYMKRFSEKYNGNDIPTITTFDIREDYIYLYENDINLFHK